MSGPLNHSPAYVLRQALVDLGLGTDPADNGDWPVYSQKEPDEPDDVLTVFDTAGRDLGKTAPDQGRVELYGIQVRVRASTFSGGDSKARTIAIALDATYRLPITVDGVNYLLSNFIRSGPPLRLGQDAPTSGRWLFVVNGLASTEMLPEFATGFHSPQVPPGGAAGQVLQKTSAADYDTAWSTPAGAGVASFNQRVGAIDLLMADVVGALGYTPVSPARSVLAGTGLAGGGTLGADITLSLPDVGTPGTYGDAGHYPVVTTDAQGRVTGVATQVVVSGSPLPVPDTTALVAGSADATKLLRFEVDGFAAGVTRVLTPPDQDGTLALLEGANTFTKAPQTVQIDTPDGKGLVVVAAASQTANLQEWQNAAGLAKLAVQDMAGVNALLRWPNIVVGEVAGLEWFRSGAFQSRLVIDPATGNFQFQDGTTTRFSIERGTGKLGVTALAAALGTVSNATFRFLANGYAGAPRMDALVFATYDNGAGQQNRLAITAGGTTSPGTADVRLDNSRLFVSAAREPTFEGIIVRGAASQAANLQEWQNSTGVVLSAFSENGYFTTRKVAAPADAELAAGELALWLDQTPGATRLMVKAKDSAGTVRTGSLALA